MPPKTPKNSGVPFSAPTATSPIAIGSPSPTHRSISGSSPRNSMWSQPVAPQEKCRMDIQQFLSAKQNGLSDIDPNLDIRIDKLRKELTQYFVIEIVTLLKAKKLNLPDSLQTNISQLILAKIEQVKFESASSYINHYCDQIEKFIEYYKERQAQGDSWTDRTFKMKDKLDAIAAEFARGFSGGVFELQAEHLKALENGSLSDIYHMSSPASAVSPPKGCAIC